MFNLFKKLFKMSTKQELEQQLAEAIAVSQRLGAENKQLKQDNDELRSSNIKLKEEFDSAVERVRYLAEQLKMKESQQQATNFFNDNDRNY